MTLPIAFFGGLVSSLSPCVLPVGPVFMGQLVGGTASSSVGTGRSCSSRVLSVWPCPLFVVGLMTVRILPLTRFLTRHSLAVRVASGLFAVSAGLLGARGMFGRVAAPVSWTV